MENGDEIGKVETKERCEECGKWTKLSKITICRKCRKVLCPDCQGGQDICKKCLKQLGFDTIRWVEQALGMWSK